MSAWLCWAGPLLVTILIEGVRDVAKGRPRLS